MSRRSMDLMAEESFFDISELFFSRTNKRGVILSGNQVFQRVSQYDWNELLAKPHSLIRHPEMPRGAFYLLWKYLLQGQPVAAYVKNRSKNGRYYWVLALALPIGNEFISIRLKPTSSIFKLIPEFYAEILSKEEFEKLSPEASYQLIDSKIRALGFEDYTHFMTTALSEELKARQETLASRESTSQESNLGLITKQQTLVKLSEEISSATKEMISVYDQNKYVSLNLHIEALKRDDGRTMGTVAEHFQKMSSQVEVEVASFDDLALRTRNELRKAQFLMLASSLIREMLLLFKNESKSEVVDFEKDVQSLEDLNIRYRESVNATLIETKEILRKLGGRCEDVASINNGLEIIRLTGKIEASRTDGWEECLEIVNGLLKFLSFSKKAIHQIQDSHGKMMSLVTDIARSCAS